MSKESNLMIIGRATHKTWKPVENKKSRNIRRSIFKDSALQEIGKGV